MTDPLASIRSRLQAKVLDEDLCPDWRPMPPARRKDVLKAARDRASVRGESVDLLALGSACGIAIEESDRVRACEAIFTEIPGPMILCTARAARLHIALLLSGAALWPDATDPLLPGPLSHQDECLALALDLLAPAEAVRRSRRTPEETARRFRLPLSVAAFRLQTLEDASLGSTPLK